MQSAHACGIWWPYTTEQTLGILPPEADEVSAEESNNLKKQARSGKLQKAFLADVTTVVIMEEIPPELVLNWDQTGIRLVLCSSWTMEKQEEKRVEMVGVNNKCQIVAVFCGYMLRDFLPVQLVYKGKTSRCHPSYSFLASWHVIHLPNHWSTKETRLQYIEHIIISYVEKVREDVGNDKAALVISGNSKG